MTAAPITQRQVRDAMVEIASGLLLGPLGEEEEIASPPVDTYLTGILWPRGTELDPLEDDELGGAAGEDEGAGDVAIPGYRAIRPCSIGLTFWAQRGAPLQVHLGTTARYVPTEGEPPRAGARPTISWRRHVLDYAFAIPDDLGGDARISTFRLPDGSEVKDDAIVVHLRRRQDTGSGLDVVTVTLINEAREDDDTRRDAACLFQTELRVTSVHGGDAPFVPPPQRPLGASFDDDARSNAMLYRDAVEFAVGHGIAAEWIATDPAAAREVRTSWMPQAPVLGTSADGHASVRDFTKRFPRALDAAWLAQQGSKVEILAALEAFVDCYAKWIRDRIEARLPTLPAHHREAAERHHSRCVETAARMRRGLLILERSDHAWRAFGLANEAMDRQSLLSGKGKRRGPLRWRPFQLGYLLLVLPGIVEPDDPDRRCMDLLWFPTGGGKTEAYLALTAFQIFLRRLADEGRRDRGGTDVLMRYTLRLLTVQQFQRAASLISVCELMRRERTDLGGARISLGLYVGGEATPNRLEAARSALAEEKAGSKPRSSPCQVLDCPCCGAKLPPSAWSAPADRAVIELRCDAPGCEAGGMPLPILTVDELIYAAPPSLLIGTVDKFAQLPRRSDLRSIFGLDEGQPPGLIIQDELHLISGPLGSMAGLYETVVDLLCTKEGVAPKVIGSTATIGQAERQVRALFDRAVLQFPPPGLDAADSFFAVRDEEGADRTYLGVTTAGRSPKFALQAVAAALLQAASVLRERGVAEDLLDPWWTCVLYFNSLRELGGAHVLMQDDVPRQIAFLAPRMKAQPRSLEAQPVELSSRVSSRDLPKTLGELAAGLDNTDPYAEQPKDAVLASNMISVGVDVPRLGLMVVNGQPKSTSEYIQASSRVGRGLPGLVITLHNAGRPRDASHFEHFRGHHAALYRSVEASSVTPWAPRARDKALHAVLCAAVRHLVDGMHPDDAAADLDEANPLVGEIVQAIIERSGAASGGIEQEETEEDVRALLAAWARRARETRASGRRLDWWARGGTIGKRPPHLMRSAEEAVRGDPAWPAPNSLREVEPSTAFRVKSIVRSTP